MLQNKGEPFVKEVISDVFARWRKKIVWPSSSSSRCEEVQTSASAHASAECQSLLTSAATNELDEKLTDPLGNLVPKLNL